MNYWFMLRFSAIVAGIALLTAFAAIGSMIGITALVSIYAPEVIAIAAGLMAFFAWAVVGSAAIIYFAENA